MYEKNKEDELILNWEQRQAIENPNINPKLREFYLKEGREKQYEAIVKKIEEENKNKYERETYYKNKKDINLQKQYEIKKTKEDLELYSIRMEIISLLAQKERRQATEKIVEFIESKEYIYTTREDIKSEMWIYERGVYKPNGKSYISEVCRKILKENFTLQIVNEVISKIETDTYIDSEKFFKNDYVNEIPLQNGILNVKTKKLSEFNPKKIFFNKLPITYNPSAQCPNIKKHFKDVLKDENDIKVMFEIFGFFLYKDYFIEKAIMFVGDGRNGKGKTIDLMKRFLGAENCSSVPLGVLNENSFRVWDLFGKMANLAGDLSSNALRDTGMLKQTTGRDLIGADRKNKTTVNFVNYAKHVFACNELPRVYDFSRGFWERWVLFEFPYTFVKKETYDKLSAEEKKQNKVMDIFIIEKITTEEELSGLLNESLEGLHRLLKQKDFSYSIGVEEVKKLWVRKSDSFTSFAMDCLKEKYDGIVTKRVLRKSFMDYCKKHKIKGASDKNIKAVLEEMFGATDKQIYQTSERVWEGVELKDNLKYLYNGGKL